MQHEINQGHVEVGAVAFKKFMSHKDECYKEEFKDMTIFSSPDSTKFSAEYDVHGTYLKTDVSLPVARGQKHVTRAGTF